MDRLKRSSYLDQWLLQLTIDIPVASELRGLYFAIKCHASLLYTVPLACSVRDLNRRVRQSLLAYAELVNELGIIKTLKYLKDIGHSLLESFYFDDDGNVFLRRHEMHLYSPIYSAIATLYDRPMFDSDFKLIRWIYQFHVYLSKVAISRPDLEGPALSAWIQRQVEPLKAEASDADYDALKSIVHWLVDMDLPELLFGRHGPGSTANGSKTITEKNTDFVLATLLSEVIDAPWSEPAKRRPPKKARPSKWLAVAKDIGSLRPITAEDAPTQYAQQGVKDWLYFLTDTLKTNPISEFIRYEDQGPSRDAALSGSYRRDPFGASTIDSSFASDRMSYDLVCKVFSGDLLEALIKTRSEYCKVPGGRRIKLSMFAGMGSALTFPIQSTLFLAISLYAVFKCAADRYGYPDWRGAFEDMCGEMGIVSHWKFVFSSLRVYGDDITIPNFAAGEAIKLLGLFGLEVNHKKSFVGDSPVREACGIFALAGRDITPLRFRAPMNWGRYLDAKLFDALRQHANSLFESGDSTARAVIVKHLVDTPPLMSGKDRKRQSRLGRKYPAQKLVGCNLLFEEYRGKDDYIGIISWRGSSWTHLVENAETLPAITSFRIKTKSEVDEANDPYYLHTTYGRYYKISHLAENRERPVAHKRTVAISCHLERVNALRVNTGQGYVWRWAAR